MRRRTRDERAANLVQHIVFRVAGDEYALPLLSVTEIVRLEGVALAPKAKEALFGSMTLRGERVPVLDLSVAFGRGRTEPTAESCVLVVEGRVDETRAPLGIAVDGVSRVLDLAPAEIAAPPRLGSLLAVDFIQAMARVNGGLVPILDLERVLASGELREAAASGPAAVPTVPADAPGDSSPAIDPPRGGGKRRRRRPRGGTHAA